MLRPVDMRRVSLRVLREDAPLAALVLGESAAFQPSVADVPDEGLAERPSADYAETHGRALAHLQKIEAVIGAVPTPAGAAQGVVAPAELDAVERRLQALWREVFAVEERLRGLREARELAVSTRETLARFVALDVDLGRLRRPGRFLSVQVGTVPVGQRQRLDEAASLAGHFAATFHATASAEYVVVAGPAERGAEVKGLLRAADFRPLEIPEAFRDHPDRVDRDLAERLESVDRDMAVEHERLASIARTHAGALERDAGALALAAPYAGLDATLRARGGLAVVEGWVPADAVETVEARLRERLGAPFDLGVRSPRRDEHAGVPTLMRHGALLGPFVALVRNYGLPRYREIDPTSMMAITFVAFFGMMFGDVGQGAVFVAVGWLLRRRSRDVAVFFAACGSASVVFGFLYGSVFGFEHVLHPLWMSPLSDPLLLLRVALVCGVAFILVVNVVTVVNLVDEGRVAAALLSAHGLAGTILYLAGIVLVAGWLDTGRVPGAALGVFAAALAVVLAFAWHEIRAATGERLIVTLVEGFETVVGYLANTLSFLRVAAFSLNHVALSIAVFAVADGFGTAGHLVTVVLGNVIIMVLEGAIVTIQVLRLHYYEGFSRFFRGDGRPFRPLRVARGAA